jgi:hypothetical protein
MRIPSYLILIASCLCAGSANAAAPDMPAVECNAASDASRPQYIVGYGSLMQEDSRKRTSPHAGPAHPVDLKGYRRGWFSRPDIVGFSTTFLGAVRETPSHLNAIAYEVDAEELRATDKREASYCRAGVARQELSVLERGFDLPAAAQVWIYVSEARRIAAPTADYPIVQSYVDIFLSGCLEQEQRFGIAGFAEDCVVTTSGWSEHWVNDRIYPRRPFVYQPRAFQIDRLLAARLPEAFSRIRIEGRQAP